MFIFQVLSHLFCSSRFGRDFWELSYHRLFALLSAEPQPVRRTLVWWGKSSGSQVKFYLIPLGIHLRAWDNQSHQWQSSKSSMHHLINKGLPDAIVIHILAGLWLFWGLFHLQVGIPGKVNVYLQILPNLSSITVRSTQKCPSLLCLKDKTCTMARLNCPFCCTCLGMLGAGL